MNKFNTDEDRSVSKSGEDYNKNKFKELKKAMTQELHIPASIYESLFNWVLFSTHAIITAQMYSTKQSVSAIIKNIYLKSIIIILFGYLQILFIENITNVPLYLGRS